MLIPKQVTTGMELEAHLGFQSKYFMTVYYEYTIRRVSFQQRQQLA